MKRKMLRILGVGLSLVLVLSFSLVAAVPVAAEEEPNYIGVVLDEQDYGDSVSTAQWVEDSTSSGNYAVELDTGMPSVGPNVDAALVVLSYNQALSTITDMGYDYKMVVGTGGAGCDAAPYIVFELDTTGDGVKDNWVVHHMFTDDEDKNVWAAWDLADDTDIPANYWVTGSPTEQWHAGGTSYANWAAVVTEFGTDTVLNIKVAVGEWASDIETAYHVDDVTINDTTYDLEPMLLDESFYNIGDTVNVKVLNGNESGTISIFAKSDTVGEAGELTIALHETGTGTGVFTGSFDLVGTTPATGELLVNDGDAIQVKTSENFNWGAGPQQLEYTDPPKATVDNAPPSIGTLVPGDEEKVTDAMPTISADLIDLLSGVDWDTAEMTLDGNVVDAIREGTNTFAYTPGEDLADGVHDVTVDVSDMVGNAETEEWSFTIVDTWVTTPTFSPKDDATIHTASPVVRVTFGEVVTITEATFDDEDVLADLTTIDDMTFRLATQDLTNEEHTISVSAEDSVGNTDTFTATFTVKAAVVTADIDLYDGWNLISLPLIPEDPDIEAVISSDTLDDVSNVSIVRAYDPATGEFLPSYVPETGSGDLATMEDGYGYWVFMDAVDTLTVTGTVMPAGLVVPPYYDVVEGWNLIGLKSLDNRQDVVVDEEITGGYLANIAGTYPVLWSWDAETVCYSNVKGVLAADKCMVVGHGFWLWATEPGTIIPIPKVVG